MSFPVFCQFPVREFLEDRPSTSIFDWFSVFIYISMSTPFTILPLNWTKLVLSIGVLQRQLDTELPSHPPWIRSASRNVSHPSWNRFLRPILPHTTQDPWLPPYHTDPHLTFCHDSLLRFFPIRGTSSTIPKPKNYMVSLLSDCITFHP